MCDGSAGFGESPNERSDVIVAIGDRKGKFDWLSRCVVDTRRDPR